MQVVALPAVSGEPRDLLPRLVLKLVLDLHSVGATKSACHLDGTLERLPVDRVEVVVVLVSECRRHRSPRAPFSRNNWSAPPASSLPSAFDCGGRGAASATACA